MYGNTAMRALATMGVALILASTSAGRDERRAIKTGEAVPAFRLMTVAGTVVDSARLRGKVVVLIYLSAEQRSSERAASDANRVVKKLAGDDVVLLFVTADWIHRADFEELWEELALDAPLGFDAERKLYRGLGLIVVPTTLVIDREGCFGHAISTRPKDYPHVLDAYVRHVLGQFDDAELEERLEARSFDSGSPKSLASRHRAAARLLREKRLLGSAEEQLRAAMKLDPDSIDIRLDLASLHLRMGKIADAELAIASVIEVKPKHRRARLLPGIMLFETDRLSEAEAVLKDALVLNPDPARTHFYLGQVYERTGETDKALEDYREALRRRLDEPAP